MSESKAVNKRPRRSQDDDYEDYNDAAIDGTRSEFSDVGEIVVNSDARAASLRRPTTTRPSDFWHISLEAWKERMVKTVDQNKVTARSALHYLRKFDTAGRLMETGEGVPALVPCHWCARPEFEHVCTLIADGSRSICAYCIRMSRSGCTARLTPRAPTSEEALVEQKLEESIAGEEQGLVEFSAAQSYVTHGRLSNTEFEQRLEQKLEERIAGVEKRLAGFHAAELCAMHGRLADTEAQLAAALAKVEGLEKAQQTWIAWVDELVQTVFGGVVARWKTISQDR